MNTHSLVNELEAHYPGLWRLLEERVTAEAYFTRFQALSDNYAPTLTVSRVQGPLVESLLADRVGPASQVTVSQSLRGSGTIGVTVGAEPAPIWLSGHADVCSYLTGPWDGAAYPLTPFCMTRAAPGRRAAMALDAPRGRGALARLAEGEMVTDEAGAVRFETERRDLPLWTRVVHHLPASWDRATDEIHGFIDNQGTCAALLLAAEVLSHYKVNAVLLLNDEEEGPVDKGNQGFSRALTRLLHRTPAELLPEVVVVSDVHEQESRLRAGIPTLFGAGALYSGVASGARGSVVPPQLVAFTRELSAALAPYGVKLTENDGYVSRSDDISAMKYTQNVSLIGFAGIYPHFDKTPTSRCGDLVQLTKTLIIYALIAQDTDWRRHVL